MAQSDAMKRQAFIINYLRNNGRTFKEIKDRLKIESEIQSADLNISVRTFQRDIINIREFYGIDIIYNRSQRLYVISNDNIDTKAERLIESFDIFNTLNITDKISKYIHFEDRKANGSNFILDIITSIKNRNIIEVYHKKYEEKDYSKKILTPLAIKEYDYRWYLIAKEYKKEQVKSYGLDRIQLIIQKPIKYTYPDDFNIDKYFNEFYGIITPNNKKAEYIELLFPAFQGNYIKSLPLHHSQKIIDDNTEFLKISLQLVPTYDFIMKLQSYAENVKVLKPKWLAEELKNKLLVAANQYK